MIVQWRGSSFFFGFGVGFFLRISFIVFSSLSVAQVQDSESIYFFETSEDVVWLDDMNDYCLAETNNQTTLTHVLGKLHALAKSKAKRERMRNMGLDFFTMMMIIIMIVIIYLLRSFFVS
jgi:hypothetical protein